MNVKAMCERSFGPRSFGGDVLCLVCSGLHQEVCFCGSAASMECD